jgi:hypothetical protein
MNLDPSNVCSESPLFSRESDGVGMPQLTFEIYLDDARYAVPTLKLIAAPDGDAALRIAELLVEESHHHLGAEICQGGQRIAGLGSFADGRASAQ